VAPRIDELITVAKRKCEILRTDPEIFDVWANFVVARERLCNIQPRFPLVSDAPSIREALEQTRDFRGVTGTISIDADHNAVKPAVVLKIQKNAASYETTINPY